LPPLSQLQQHAEGKRHDSDPNPYQTAPKGSGELFSNAPHEGSDHVPAQGPSELCCSYGAGMPLRSQPAAITPVRNRSGSQSFRVTATIRGKQRKRHFLCLEDAQAVQADWELERLQVAASLRPKVTRLTNADLVNAEAAIELLKGSGLSLLAAAKHALLNRPTDGSGIPYSEALKRFLEEKTGFISPSQHENYRLVGRRFGEFVGPLTLGEISTDHVLHWLKSLDVGKKTWNSYRADLSGIFSWFCADPRCWLAKNPVIGVPRHKARALRKGIPDRLAVEDCRKLMLHLEERQPAWCTFFALALFAGIRPDMHAGELFKLARALEQDPVEKYFANGFIHLTPELTKDARPRQTTIHQNLAAWLAKYPPTPASVCPGDWAEYQTIRSIIGIPHDGLRHTAISAFVAKYGSLGQAALEFGNSERIIREAYLNRMSATEAVAFYSILPRT